MTLPASLAQSLGLAANAAIGNGLMNGGGEVSRPTGEVMSAEFGTRCFRLVRVDGTGEDFSYPHCILQRGHR